jgi:lysophospholipase L1-like esterase
MRVAPLALLVALTGCAGPPPPTIVCIGDSITAGVTRSPVGTQPTEMDAHGGYPGRLQELVGNRARVRNRGVPAAGTAFWHARPTDGPALELGGSGWADLRMADLPPSAPTMLRAVLAVDRPDVVVLLIGVNDLYYGQGMATAALVDASVTSLEALHLEARAVAPTVFVSTLLPNHRDPPEQIEAVNARIRAAHPDHLPLGERFAAADWERLIDDGIHPNAAGYALLAQTLAAELETRRLVAANGGG